MNGLHVALLAHLLLVPPYTPVLESVSNNPAIAQSTTVFDRSVKQKNQAKTAPKRRIVKTATESYEPSGLVDRTTRDAINSFQTGAHLDTARMDAESEKELDARSDSSR